MDLHQQLADLGKKIAAIRKAPRNSYFTAALCLVQDNECAKLLMELSDDDMVAVINEIRRDKSNDLLADKLDLLLCYRAEIRRLADINLRALTGITRDEVAKMQRVVAVRGKAIGVKKCAPVLELLTKMLIEFHDAECNDRDLLEEAQRQKQQPAADSTDF